MARSLTEVGQDLCELGDHDVVGCQSRLSLKDGIQSGSLIRERWFSTDYRGREGRYLHTWAVGFAADQRGGDVCVGELIVQVHHVGHPAWQEELIPLDLARAEYHTVDVPTWWGGGGET